MSDNIPGRLFRVSKAFNAKLGEILPARVLPRFPSVSGILKCIQSTEDYCKDCDNYHLKYLLSFPKYRTAISRLLRIEPYLWYSPLFSTSQGSQRIKRIASIHGLESFNQGRPHRLRQIWSSLARDPLIFGSATIGALSFIGVSSWWFYNLYTQYNAEFAQNLYFVTSPAFLNQYYAEDTKGLWVCS